MDRSSHALGVGGRRDRVFLADEDERRHADLGSSVGVESGRSAMARSAAMTPSGDAELMISRTRSRISRGARGVSIFGSMESTIGFTPDCFTFSIDS